jgi:hypothetical protein
MPVAFIVPLSAGPALKLLHPRPPPAGGLLHGQGMIPPEPGRQNCVIGETVQPARTMTLAGNPTESKVWGGAGFAAGLAEFTAAPVLSP